MAITPPVAPRVTPEDVRAIVETDEGTALDSFISTANALTDFLASKDVDGVIPAVLLAEIERYLAAHYYSLLDPLYRSKSTGGASGTFQGTDGMGLNSTHYGQNAIALDPTGRLLSLSKGSPVAKVAWLGTPARNARTYATREGS